MAEGRKRSGPPQDSSSSQTRQRFSAPNYPDARRRNMMKAIAAALVVLGMFMTAGATPYAPKTRAPIYKPHRVSWPELRDDLHRRKAFRRTVRMSEESFVKLADLLRPALQKNKRFGSEFHIIECTWYIPYEYVPGRVARRLRLPPRLPSYGCWLGASLIWPNFCVLLFGCLARCTATGPGAVISSSTGTLHGILYVRYVFSSKSTYMYSAANPPAVLLIVYPWYLVYSSTSYNIVGT